MTQYNFNTQQMDSDKINSDPYMMNQSNPLPINSAFPHQPRSSDTKLAVDSRLSTTSPFNPSPYESKTKIDRHEVRRSKVYQ